MSFPLKMIKLYHLVISLVRLKRKKSKLSVNWRLHWGTHGIHETGSKEISFYSCT